LRMIPGVGDRLAADIVALREKKGRFEKLDQLMEVKGIKENKLAKLRPYLFIDSYPEL